MQIEIKVIVYNPAMDLNVFVADVYRNGQRVHCGKGGTRAAAVREAGDFIANKLILP